MSRVPGWLVNLIIVVALLFIAALVIHALGGFTFHVGFFRMSVSMAKAGALRRG